MSKNPGVGNIDEGAVRAALGDTSLTGFSWVAETGSTNADLLEQAGAAAPGAVAVLGADHQRSGRGRRDRRWESPPGSNLLLSLLLWPTLPPADWVAYIAAVSIAVVDTARALGAEVGVKWPNDVVDAEGAKLAGVLTEVAGPTSRRTESALVVGVGFNVGWPTADEGPPGSTSLAALLGAAPDRQAVLIDLLQRLDPALAALGRGELAALRAAHRERCLTLGRSVRVELADGTAIEGVASDLTATGQLIIESGGEQRIVTVGDVHHLR